MLEYRRSCRSMPHNINRQTHQQFKKITTIILFLISLKCVGVCIWERRSTVSCSKSECVPSYLCLLYLLLIASAASRLCFVTPRRVSIPESDCFLCLATKMHAGPSENASVGCAATTEAQERIAALVVPMALMNGLHSFCLPAPVNHSKKR
jgi:hypothetical protein